MTNDLINQVEALLEAFEAILPDEKRPRMAVEMTKLVTRPDCGRDHCGQEDCGREDVVRARHYGMSSERLACLIIPNNKQLTRDERRLCSDVASACYYLSMAVSYDMWPKWVGLTQDLVARAKSRM
jgi:hypothetical protein